MKPCTPVPTLYTGADYGSRSSTVPEVIDLAWEPLNGRDDAFSDAEYSAGASLENGRPVCYSHSHVGRHPRPTVPEMSQLGPVLFLLILLAVGGCREEPVIEGEWSGVANTERGTGFYYTFTLDQVNDDLIGQGGISVYSGEGVPPESTLTVQVEGTYEYPNVVFTIKGPIPTMSERGTVDFSGFLTSDGRRIEGTVSSPVLGTLDLDLERMPGE